MRASRTYIAGLGATGVLIAASVVLLLVVSGLVAFRGWSDGGVGNDVGSVVMEDDKPSMAFKGPKQVAAAATEGSGSVSGVSAAGAAANAAGAVSAAEPADAGVVSAAEPAGGVEVAGDAFTGPSSSASQTLQLPQDGTANSNMGGDQVTLLSVLDDAGGNVGGVVQSLAGGLGDTTGALTYELGERVGELNEPLGMTIRDTGVGVSDLLDRVGDVTGGLLGGPGQTGRLGGQPGLLGGAPGLPGQ